MRVPAAKTNRKPRLAKLHTTPAPVTGWIANQNLLTPNARKSDGSVVYGAAVLENWFPTATGARMRGGSENHAQIGNGAQDVTAIFAYANGNNRKLFAAVDNAIYNITNPVVNEAIFVSWGGGDTFVDGEGNNVVVRATSDDQEVDSLSGGDWSFCQFSTAGGTFLRGVNGADTPLVYDGSSWSTSPAITGSGLTAASLSFVWASKSRLWFIEKDTLDAWYLPVNQIGGTATKFPLGGIFNKGGSLIYGGVWSVESGDGPSEQTVFVTSEGEVAAYRGTDPASSDGSWLKVGVYQIGKPRGPRAFSRGGGDLIIATDIGLVPLSEAFQRDVAALSEVAVSYNIETEWNRAIAERSYSGWNIALWPTKQMMIVAPPVPAGLQPMVFVTNARTGAWAKYTGWDVKCLQLFGDRMFFGSTNGNIIEAEVTGYDKGATYTCSCVPLFDPLKSPGSLKTGLQSRVIYKATKKQNVLASLQSDYEIRLQENPDAAVSVGTDVWGAATWGSSVWSSPASKLTFGDWVSTPGRGYSLSSAVQITSGAISAPDVELIQIDMTYDQGDLGT